MLTVHNFFSWLRLSQLTRFSLDTIEQYTLPTNRNSHSIFLVAMLWSTKHWRKPGDMLKKSSLHYITSADQSLPVGSSVELDSSEISLIQVGMPNCVLIKFCRHQFHCLNQITVSIRIHRASTKRGEISSRNRELSKLH